MPCESALENHFIPELRKFFATEQLNAWMEFPAAFFHRAQVRGSWQLMDCLRFARYLLDQLRYFMAQL